MEKPCALGLFSFATLLALDSAFAAQIEAVAENGRPPIRKSSDARTLVMNCAAFPARQLDHSTDKARGKYEDFVTGLVTRDGNAWGRPAGITVAKDGSLLFSEDGNGTIWRVSYPR